MRRLVMLVAGSLVILACGSGAKPTPAPPCDSVCADSDGVRAIREMIKLAYNLTLQGKPVGSNDVTVNCPLGGTVRVYGTASSNTLQGATNVNLTYVFTGCAYSQKDTTPEENYDITLTGTFTEDGVLAVQPTSTTAISIAAKAITLDGEVYDPPVPYHADSCDVTLGQDGNHVGGTLCGREVGADL